MRDSRTIGGTPDRGSTPSVYESGPHLPAEAPEVFEISII